MVWLRRDKPGSEPKHTNWQPVPKKTQPGGSDKYCTDCDIWYGPGQRKNHEH